MTPKRIEARLIRLTHDINNLRLQLLSDGYDHASHALDGVPEKIRQAAKQVEISRMVKPMRGER